MSRFKELERMLSAEAPGATIEVTNGNHLAILLPNGRKVFTSHSPSDRRTLMNVRSQVRRSLRVA